MGTKSYEKPLWEKRNTRWKQIRKDFEKDCEDLQGHASNVFPNRLRPNRGGPYRLNGYFYTERKGSRLKVYTLPLKTIAKRLKKAGINPKGYRNVPPADVPKSARRLQATYYTFDYKPARDENNWITSNKPYAFQGHHLIPNGVIKEDVFGAAAWAILEKLPYDLNHGENIMLLPSQDKPCGIHRLPKHNGYHTGYSETVEADVAKLKTALEDVDCENPKPPPIAVLNQLIQLESKYWNFLKRLGKSATPGVSSVPSP